MNLIKMMIIHRLVKKFKKCKIKFYILSYFREKESWQKVAKKMINYMWKVKGAYVF